MVDLDIFKDYLDSGTYGGQDWSSFSVLPKSRYHSFKYVIDFIKDKGFCNVLELGTCRSFMDGAYEGCNKDDEIYWYPNDPSKWDWGAGIFGLVIGLCVRDVHITTVDIAESHIKRCRVMTQEIKGSYSYVVSDSLDYLASAKIQFDVIYLDTGDMTPIEETAGLQFEESRLIVERNLLKDYGIILIDDYRNQTPRKYGDESGLGKSKYSLPYLQSKGFVTKFDGYQVAMIKI